MVLGADCLPVALATAGAVAMVHAGWKGLAEGVIERGVEALRALEGSSGEEILAVLGPCAGVCCYEVGPEVHAALGTGIEQKAPCRSARDRARTPARGGGHRGEHARRLHDLRRALLLPPPRRSGGGTPGGDRVVELRTGLSAERIASNLRELRAEIAALAPPGGTPVRVLAATKYVAAEELPALAAGGVELVGENRAQDLESKAAVHGARFEWHFIGQLQSRKVRSILPHVSLIHSLASRSALDELSKHAALAREGAGVLIEVNVAGEEGKAGIAPAELHSYIEDSPLPVLGLMTMPPLASEPERSRRWFAALRELASEHGLRELSMGTSQDYPIAVQEGATIVRIGTRLYD